MAWRFIKAWAPLGGVSKNGKERHSLPAALPSDDRTAIREVQPARNSIAVGNTEDHRRESEPTERRRTRIRTFRRSKHSVLPKPRFQMILAVVAKIHQLEI